MIRRPIKKKIIEVGSKKTISYMFFLFFSLHVDRERSVRASSEEGEVDGEHVQVVESEQHNPGRAVR